MTRSTSDSFETAKMLVYVIHWQAVDWCAEAVTSLLAGGSVTVVVVDNGGAPRGELRERLPSDVEIVEAGYNAETVGDVFTEVVRNQEMRNQAFIINVTTDFLEKQPEILFEAHELN